MSSSHARLRLAFRSRVDRAHRGDRKRVVELRAQRGRALEGAFEARELHRLGARGRGRAHVAIVGRCAAAAAARREHVVEALVPREPLALLGVALTRGRWARVHGVGRALGRSDGHVTLDELAVALDERGTARVELAAQPARSR